MEEKKINVSIKVWIYILLAVAACFAIIMGVSRAIGGPESIGANKYHMITMFICITSHPTQDETCCHRCSVEGKCLGAMGRTVVWG